MIDTASNKWPGRFSAIILTSVISFLLVQNRAQLALSDPRHKIAVLGVLVGITTLWIVAWKLNGILFSIVATTIFYVSDRQAIESKIVLLWQFDQFIFLTVLALHFVVLSNMNARHRSRLFWLLCFVVAIVFSAALWLEAEQSARYFANHAEDGWRMTNQRMRMCAFVLFPTGGLIGLLGSRRGNAFAWLIGSLLAIIGGFGLARLKAPVTVEHIAGGTQCDRFFGDMVRWITQPDLINRCVDWCWTAPYVTLPLMLLGLWRALCRGARQRQRGESPLAWLLFFPSLLLLATLLPVASEQIQPLGLLWLGIALSVFAVADLLHLLFEQLALPAPPTGPSGVPRV